MNTKYCIQLALFLLLTLAGSSLLAQTTSGNPIIRHLRTADPSVEIWQDGQVWIYASHDMDDATEYATMDGYHVFSSYDLVNWTDHGEVLHSRDVDWGLNQGGFMFAPDAAYKDGTYYLYYPHPEKGWKGWRVGVATSDKPEGPFTDQGFIEGTDEIDPTVFIDDDEQAYLTWAGGYNGPWIARLKENMMELAEEPRLIDYGSDDCGEGPYIHKRNGIYYFSYTDHAGGAHGAYSMGTNVYGPYEYKGKLAPSPQGAQDHHSMIEYHGQWYYFYHVGNYGSDASMFRRNVCIDSMFYNEDGSIQQIVHTTTGVGADPIGSAEAAIIPGRLESEATFSQSGTSTIQAGEAILVNDIHSGDQLEYVLQVLGKERYELQIQLENPLAGTAIFVEVDNVPADTFRIIDNSSTYLDSLFLNKGRHTLKLLFHHESSMEELLQLDFLDISGDMSYHTIQASASQGGAIFPSGTVYVNKGGDKEFRMHADRGYALDSLLVDGEHQQVSSSYTFTGVNTEHRIDAYFSSCEGVEVTPLYKIGEGEWTQGTEVKANEGDSLQLKVEFEGSDLSEIIWYYPGGTKYNIMEMGIESLRVSDEGSYEVNIVDQWICSSFVAFNVHVEPIVLDVYQAEDWHEQSGVVAQACTDLGGGYAAAYIDDGDWCSYTIDIPKTGIYGFTARVATAGYGGYIIMTIDDQEKGRLLVKDELSNGWQDWYTSEAVEVELEEGTHVMKMTFMGMYSPLFNVNWFDLEFNRELPVSFRPVSSEPAWQYTYHASPPSYQISFTLAEEALVSVDVVNMAGIQVRSLLEPGRKASGSYQLNWMCDGSTGSYLNPGVYLLIFTANQHRQVGKLMLY